MASGAEDSLAGRLEASADYWAAHTWELPGLLPSAHAPAGTQRSVAVGAVVCPLALVQTVRQALDQNRWLKKHGVNVSRFVGSAARSEAYRRLHTANRAEALRARKLLKESTEETTEDGSDNMPPLPEVSPASSGPTALMACHVSPEGAIFLDLATSGHPKAGEGKLKVGRGKGRKEQRYRQDYHHLHQHLPEDLAALLAPGGGAYWVPGLRVGSPECLHKGDGPGSKKKSMTTTPSQQSSEPPAFTFAELFAGVGGFRVGLEAVGGRCVFSSEIDREAVATYRLNHGGSGELHGDITELEGADLPAHDLLCAGWPCQPFSRAGDQAGFEDVDRGHLFFEIIRCVQAARPRVLLLENVANVLKVEGGRVMASVLGELAGNGYKAFYRVINARAVLPQQRERLYIVAFRCEEGGHAAHPGEEEQNARLAKAAAAFAWPELKLVPRCVREVLEEGVDLGEYRLTEHQRAKVMASQDWAAGRRVARLEGGARTLMASYKHSYHLYSEFVPVGGRDGRGNKEATEVLPKETERLPEETKELPETTEGPPEDAEDLPELRFYTPREAARLMGFPETFRVGESTNRNHWYHQVGLSSSPPSPPSPLLLSSSPPPLLLLPCSPALLLLSSPPLVPPGRQRRLPARHRCHHGRCARGLGGGWGWRK